MAGLEADNQRCVGNFGDTGIKVEKFNTKAMAFLAAHPVAGQLAGGRGEGPPALWRMQGRAD